MPVRRLGLCVLGAAGIMLAAPAFAQTGGGLSLGQLVDAPPAPLSLRIVDEERLFQGSQFGQRVARDLDVASRALEAENAQLLEQLTAQENALSEARATMSVEEFRAAATAFDAEAEAIRRAQAEKRQRLSAYDEAEQRRFFSLIGPILQEVLAEKGGQILIDARAVVIGVADIDITEDAIKALDDALGDGGPADFPLTQP